MRASRRQLLAATGLLVAAASLVGCDRVWTYRYRLTMTVRSAGQLHTGSSVVQVSTGLSSGILSSAYLEQSKGQATVVDLGDGRLVLALLEGSSRGTRGQAFQYRPWLQGPTQLLLNLYRLKVEKPGQGDSHDRLLKERGARAVTPDQLPDLVTFKNNNDPTSLVVVDPNDLSAVMGPGTELVGAAIEVVDQPISTGLTRYLPWLKGKMNYIDGRISTYGTVGFRKDQFIRGISN